MKKDLPILLYTGENEYELNKSIKDLEEETGFSVREVSDPLDFQDLIDILNMPALFEGNLLYKITNESIMNDDKNLGLLKEYLGNPSSFSKAVIIARKPDMRKKSSKFFKENNLIFDFGLKKGAELRRWIKEYMWQHGYNIAEDAVGYMLEVVGDNQTAIQNELEKLFIYEPQNKNIGIKDLEILITNNVQSNIFNLLDNMYGDRGKMLAALENLFKLKEPVTLVIYMIIRELRIILRIKWYLKEKYSDDKIAVLLQLHPYVAKKKTELARKVTFEETFKYLKLFYEVEERLKTGKGEGKNLVRATLLSMK